MQKRGFSIIELLIVMSIIGVMAAFAFPKMQDAIIHEATRGARREVATQLMRARAAAAQRGCRATVHMDAATTRVWVTACKVTGTGLDTLGPFSRLDVKYNVTMTSTADSLPFAANSMGMGTGTISMAFTRSGYTSSLRITAIGRAVW